MLGPADVEVTVRTIWIAGLALLALACTDRKPKASSARSAERAAQPAAPVDAAPVDATSATAAPATAPVDAAPADAMPTVGQCVGEPGDKPIMAPCSTHCECVTGFCYDEAFNGGGFCSMDCNAPSIGDCAELRHPSKPQHQKYGCLRLDGMKVKHDLKTTRICVLRCSGVDECRGYSPRYDQCGNFSGGRGTQWGGFTLGLFGTCLVSSAVDPERH